MSVNHGNVEMNHIDPCEWNPTRKEAAAYDDIHAQAEVMVGANVEWRLCKSCSELPEFKKYRVRRAIK